MARIAERALLLVIAMAAITWLAHGIHDLNLDATSQALLSKAGANPKPAQVSAATSLLHRAAQFNADPQPRLDEANLDYSIGGYVPAERVLRPVVQQDSGDIDAWSLMLAAAEGAGDRPMMMRAAAALRGLYGHLAGYPLGLGTFRDLGGNVVIVAPEQLTGLIEHAYIRGSYARFVGWTADVSNQVLADEMLVVSGGHVVAAVVPRKPRGDVAFVQGSAVLRSGFDFFLPLSRLHYKSGRPEVSFYGVEQPIASPLEFDCVGRFVSFSCPS